MRAAVIREYGSIGVEDVPEPSIGEYAVRCRLRYGATCTGTDSHIIAGRFPWLSPLPTILGHESVGRVVEVGPKVRSFRVGDLLTRVGTPAIPSAGISVNWGGFAEVGIAYDHDAMRGDGLAEGEWNPHRVNCVVPPSVDERDAPMFTTWRETLSYVNRAGVAPGATVLVVGSGGNGLAIAAHAINLGAQDVVMVGSAIVAERAARHLPALTFLDYRDATTIERLRDGYPDGFAFVFDAIGRQSVVDGYLGFVREAGVYSTYGIDEYGAIEVDLSLARPGVIHHPCVYDEAETHAEVCSFVTRGLLTSPLWYDRDASYPLEAIAEAFADVVDRRLAPKALICLWS